MRSREKSVALLAAAAAGLCFLSQVNAAAYTWVAGGPGNSNSQWTQHKNWSGGPSNSIPSTTADTVTFTGTTPTTITAAPAGPIGGATFTAGTYNVTGLGTNDLTLDGGSLGGGTYTVYADYTDAGWTSETGNTFNPKLHASGTTINAAGANSLLVRLPDLSTLSGGGSGSIDLGTIMVGQSVSFTFQHTQASGLTFHEALQTPNFGGMLSILHGATPVDQTNGELLAYTSSAIETYSLVADAPGSISGSLKFLGNFDNPGLAPITIAVTGTVVPVPEPSSAVMLGIGTLYAASRRRRRD